MSGTIITFAIVGILLSVVGILFLAFKSAIMMMSGYEEGKYDDEKLRKHIGWHLLMMGIGFLFTALMSALIYEYAVIFILAYIPALIAIIVKMIFQGEKRYRIKTKIQ